MGIQFQELNSRFETLSAGLFAACPAIETEIFLSSLLQQIRLQADDLILYDAVTGAMNLRAENWFIAQAQIQAVAKVDLYDMRQANRVFGQARVDQELRRLAFLFRSVLPERDGYYVRRSAGSDEYKLISTKKPEKELARVLSQLYQKDQAESLFQWDFGVGPTYERAEKELIAIRKKNRPQVIRQTRLDSHSEIPRYIQQQEYQVNWQDFSRPYDELSARLETLALEPGHLAELQMQISLLRDFVGRLAIQDELTGTLNALGKKWALQAGDFSVKSVALTDMLDMHEANLQFGDQAVDVDIQRFGRLLLDEFKSEAGFLVVRSAWAGDEFQIVSSQLAPEQLARRFEAIHRQDISRGLLKWSYGVGENESEAHNQLYRHRVTGAGEHFTAGESQPAGPAFFLVARPQPAEYDRLLHFANEIAGICSGTVITDLHFTLQSMRNVQDLEALRIQLRDYCAGLPVFSVEIANVARVNLNHQPGRIWFMLQKTPVLTRVYEFVAGLSRQMGFSPYPYPVGEWKPHVKGVLLSSDSPPTTAHPIFHQVQLSFLVDHLELTAQVGADQWQFVERFDFNNKTGSAL